MLEFLTSFPTLLAAIGIDDAIIIGCIATAVGASTTSLGSWLGNKNSKKQISRDAALNYKYQLLMAENGPTASVNGLRKAGLNPMLAVNGGISTPTMPSVKSDMSNTGNPNAAAALDTAMSLRSTESTVDLQDTQSDLNKAQEKLTGIRAANELANRGLGGKFGALSRVLSEFGFDTKTVKEILPAFQTNKNVPNGSERLTNATAMQNVPSPRRSSDDDFEDFILSDEGRKRYEVLKQSADDIYRNTGERPPIEALDTRFKDADKVYRREKYRRHSSIYTRSVEPVDTRSKGAVKGYPRDKYKRHSSIYTR